MLLLNPFYHLLQVVRAPLLGQSVDALTYIVLSILAVVGWVALFWSAGAVRITRDEY